MNDPSTQDIMGLVEVKYVQVREEENLEESLLRKRICAKNYNLVTMNTKHQYYYEIQQQMYVTGRMWTDFVVKGSQSNELYCERVYFSRNHWDLAFPKLEAFYNNWIVPELPYPRVKYGMTKLDLRSI